MGERTIIYLDDAINLVEDLETKRLQGDVGLLYAPMIKGLKALPSAPQRTGRWIPQDHNKSNGMVSTAVFYYPKCSECGHSGNYDMNFCPNCGAEMRGEQNG